VSPLLSVQVTISIGGAYAPEWVRSTADLWIERADLQLYSAKSGGRNQVCLDQPRELAGVRSADGRHSRADLAQRCLRHD
jgi:predicted signal transduction protein with EAL and GGDEF domain